MAVLFHRPVHHPRAERDRALTEIKDTFICPNCKASNSFYLRDDDKEEVIRKSMEIFRRTTEPVLQHYAKQGKVISINGLGSAEEVNKELLKTLYK